jgi:hypothetical protein
VEQTAPDKSELRERLQAAEARIKQFSDAARLCDTCIDLLARARSALAADRPADAWHLIFQVECLLQRAESSEETVRRWRTRIWVYELAWLSALIAASVLGAAYVGRLPWLSAHRPLGWMPPAPYFAWGALGGVVAALFGLYRHAALRDFDRGYVAWYFFKPIMGFVLGPLIYLFARAGLMAIQAEGTQVNEPELLYLGAFVLGFGERFSIRLIDRVAAAIFGPTQTPPGPAPTPPPAASSAPSAPQ